MEDARLHAEAREPAGGALDLAAAVDVVVAVGDHRDADRDAQDQQPEPDLVRAHVYVRHANAPHGGFSAARTLPAGRRCPPDAGSSVVPDTSVSEPGSPSCRLPNRNEPVAEPTDYDPFEEFNRSAGIGVVENPYPMFALVRGRAPDQARRLRRGDGRPTTPTSSSSTSTSTRAVAVFTAYGFDAVQQVLKDGETFSSAGYADIMGPVFGHSILEMDEPEHHTYRGLVQQAFSRKAMETWERDLVRGVVDEMLDAIIDAKRGDLVRSLTFPFPVLVIARMLGLPREDLPDVPPPGGRDDQRRLRVRPRRSPRRTRCSTTSARSSPSAARIPPTT